jgi:hypothetical protein
LTGFDLADGAAVGTDHDALGGQGVEVGPGGDRGDGESLDQVTNSDLAFLFDEIQNLATTLFRQQP